MPTFEPAAGARARPPGPAPWPFVLVLAFALSRLVIFDLGVHLDPSGVARLWQLIDPELLRQDLARSLFYSHGQPPLFNLYVGLGLKLAGAAAGGVFQVVQLLVGGALALSVFLTSRALGVSAASSRLVALLFSVSPGAIGFENHLFYPIFEAALLCGAAALLHRYLREGGVWSGGGCFALLGAMVLLRSYFHVAWLLAMVMLALLLRREDWRRTLALAAVPVLASSLWYAKNEWLYGSFCGSTWLGLNLSRITIQTLPAPERKRLVREGVMSPLARLDSFGPLQRYEGLVEPLPPTGIPVLDRPRKSNGGSNYNNLAYVDLSRRYLQDALALVRARPRVYARGIRSAFEYYLRPVSELRELVLILRPLGRYRSGGEVFFYGRVGMAGRAAGMCVLVLVGLPVLWIHGLASLLRQLRKGPPDPATAGALAFIVFNVAYVTLAANLLDRGENNRFRFTIEPLLAVLAASFLHEARGDLRRRFRARARWRPRHARPS